MTVVAGALPRHRAASELAKARQHAQADRWENAIADYERAFGFDPDNALANNDFAWLLATCAAAQLRDPGRALELARRAVARMPNNAAFRNTLGVAYYRTGQWRSAIAELAAAEQLQPGKYFVHNALFLAMAHGQLGEKSEARQWFDQATLWLDENKANPPYDQELRRFHAEAEELLGL